MPKPPRWTSWNVWVVLDKDDRYIFGAVVPHRGEHKYQPGDTKPYKKARITTPGNGSMVRGVLTLLPPKPTRKPVRKP